MPAADPTRHVPDPARVGEPTAEHELLRSVFDRFPHAVMVVADSRRILRHNAASDELFGLDALRGPTTCCCVLGCPTGHGTVPPDCVTERALAADEPLRDVPVRLPRDGGDVLVSAAVLDLARSSVVLEA